VWGKGTETTPSDRHLLHPHLGQPLQIYPRYLLFHPLNLRIHSQPPLHLLVVRLRPYYEKVQPDYVEMV
jgi:hypothetical protein